jgi:cytochrome c-type biogenesis protein CcmF
MYVSSLTGILFPPAWSLFTGDLGRFLIVASAALFVLSAAAWLLAPRFGRLDIVGKLAFPAGAGALLGAFTCLGVLFAFNRFEFEYVYGHSDLANALAYRIAGIWSGQEGSFLLWGTCSALFGLFTVTKTEHYRRWYTVVFALFLAAIAGILALESPFNLNLVEGKPFVPADGLGLAPALQNYWVIIHPPVIFLGFGSLTTLFALAVAALAVRDYDAWIAMVRPWAIVACTLVGLGLCMGGFWAYETLGWGGFWMWDPVENVSFVPWLFSAALIHGIIVQAARRKWQIANLILAALPFILFVYGTFLTRSGLLSDASVHSFSEMDRTALKVLIGVMATASLGFLALWGVRAFQHRKVALPDDTAASLRREAFYMLGITMLVAVGLATAIGMSVPLVQALRGEKPRVVEEAVYHQVLSWLFVPLMLIMAVAPLVKWRGTQLRDLGSRLYSYLCIAIGVTGLLVFLTAATPFGRKIELSPTVTMLGRFETPGLAWIVFLFALCVLTVAVNLGVGAQLAKRSKLGMASYLTHVGVALLLAGMVISRGLERKGQSMVMEGMPGRLMTYEVRYAGMTRDEYHRDNQLKLQVYDAHRGGAPLFTATPGVYKVPMGDGQESTMVWPHIERTFLMDTYVSLGSPQTDATQDITLEEGKSFRFGDTTLTNERMTRTGEPGQAGTQFGARILVEKDGQTSVVNPHMELGGPEGVKSHPAKISNSLNLAMVGMDAATKSATLRLQLTTPIYPIEIYHKPLTSLVWLGTGFMTLGGFLAAYYRRSRRAAAQSEPVAVSAPEPERIPVLTGEKA